MENDTLLKELLLLLEKLEKENLGLREKVEELSEKKEPSVCLSQLRDAPIGIDDYVRNMSRRQSELSTSKEATLQNKIRKTVDNLLQYADSVGFQ
jgi:Na+/phosphate symporter